MSVRVDRASLTEAATWVSAAVSKNPSLPILNGMLLQARDGNLTLAGFDYDTLHRVTLSCEGDDLIALVSARFLTQVVGALGGGDVTLDVADGRLVLASGRSTYQARVMNASDYPQLPTFPRHVGEVDADALSDLIGTVGHAVSKDPSMKAMAAVNIAGEAGLLEFAATDRFRVARTSSKWADASGVAFEVNVPGPALVGAVKSMRGQVQVGADEGLFGVSDSSRIAVTRILGTEDKFPRLAPLFNLEPTVRIEVEVASFADALKRSLVVADETGAVFVAFTDGLISVVSDGANGGGSEEVDCSTGFGEGEDRYKFNARYLLDTLAACPAPRITLGLTGPGKQMLLEPVGIDSAAFIVMSRRAA